MSVSTLTPAEVIALRRQGVSAVARAAQRHPGGFHTLPGGVPVLSSLVGAYVRVPWWRALLTAICWVESKGDPQAVSTTGALGPMQLTSSLYYYTKPSINPFQWGPALRRAVAVLQGLYQRAEGVAEPGEDAIDIALAAWKEGWDGSQRPERQKVASHFVTEVRETLDEWFPSWEPELPLGQIVVTEGW